MSSSTAQLTTDGRARLYSVLAPCAHCGAHRGEWCVGQYGKRTASMHVARKSAVATWRKASKTNEIRYQMMRAQCVMADGVPALPILPAPWTCAMGT